MLTSLDTDLWAVDHPLRMFGLHLGTRMTVVRLGNGGLFIHSPIPLTEPLRRAIDGLGEVRHIVAPNLFHHLSAGDFAKAYPKAALHGAPGLAKKRSDLSFTSELGTTPHLDWSDDLEQVPILGTMLREIVFFHPKTGTLVSSDLAENFTTSEHWWTRGYLKMSGIHGKIGMSRLLRPLFRDHQAVRESLDRVQRWALERIVLAHGNIIEHDCHAALSQTYAWLRR